MKKRQGPAVGKRAGVGRACVLKGPFAPMHLREMYQSQDPELARILPG